MDVHYPAEHGDFIKRCQRRTSFVQLRCSYNMSLAITIACIRICMERMYSRFNSPYFQVGQDEISPEANLCRLSGVPACSRVRKWCQLRQEEPVAFAVHQRPVQGANRYTR
jgi:hypothetical protein